MKYKEPCMCGAEDCSRCYPQPKVEREPEDPTPEKPYNWRDKKNEWMDYIHEGYREPRGI